MKPSLENSPREAGLAASLLDLTRALVRTPSRAGVDGYGGVFAVLESWLAARGVPVRRLAGEGGGPVALVAEVAGRPGPQYWLNATIDTAGFGDESVWSAPPTSAELRDGWLYGRGSADSKAGAAIFCHIAADWMARRQELGGCLKLVFDGDEHSGDFGGIRRALESEGGANLQGVLLGYPGFDKVGIGGRGFERAVVSVHGKAAHSGASSQRGVNAVSAAARLVEQLEAAPLPATPPPSPEAGEFPLPPTLTVTGIEGGGAFSEVPDLCRVQVDMRLTPSFCRQNARRHLEATLEALGLGPGHGASAQVAWIPGWPAYKLPAHSRVARALLEAAGEILNRPVPPAVVGPSNVANLLYHEGIEATCGFGVTYRNAHATDECIEVATLEPVYRVYHRAVRKLLAGP